MWSAQPAYICVKVHVCVARVFFLISRFFLALFKNTVCLSARRSGGNVSYQLFCSCGERGVRDRTPAHYDTLWKGAEVYVLDL
jgi:hypothetical protein